MKQNQVTETYVAPCVEILKVSVEQGFASSAGVKAAAFSYSEDDEW